jgi:HEAT repeat protein
MPLVRRPTISGATSSPEASEGDPLIRLSHADPEIRWSAARALAELPEGLDALARALPGEADPRVREAITTGLMRVGSEEAVSALLTHLRSDNAAIRTLVVEALQGMRAAASHLPDLMADPDPDVRILAAEIARNMPPEEATGLLADALAGEQHPNVAASIVEVLIEVGTSDAVDALRMARRRFAAEPFLPFAVDIALERLARSEP